LTQARAEVERLNAELERRAIERTAERALAESDKRQEAAALYRAEGALRASEERARCYLELGLVGMAIVSPATGWLEVNDRLCEILGYERRELMQTTWAALVHPDDLAGEIGNYDRILAGEVDGYLMPKRWIRKNGDVVHTNVAVKCRRREDRSVDYFAAMVEEVTGLDRLAARGPEAAGKARSGMERHDRLPCHKDLSGREREVARLIGLGRTVKQIAAELALSEKTVSTYRSRILTKLDLKSTAELIRYAIENRIAQ
jgi:PAS domain S-box-containing protein